MCETNLCADNSFPFYYRNKCREKQNKFNGINLLVTSHETIPRKDCTMHNYSRNITTRHKRKEYYYAIDQSQARSWTTSSLMREMTGSQDIGLLTPMHNEQGSLNFPPRIAYSPARVSRNSPSGMVAEGDIANS